MGTREQEKKMKISLNMFDALVLLIVVAIGGLVFYYNMSSNAPSRNNTSQLMRYTILMNNMREGSGELVREGSDVHDVIKNYHIGTVVSKEITPAVEQHLDHENRIYRTATLEGKEDVYVVMEAMVTDLGDEFIVDGGYTVRVGEAVFLHGEGYMAAGNVVAIERPQ